MKNRNFFIRKGSRITKYSQAASQFDEYDSQGTKDYMWITASCFLEISKWNYLLNEIRQFSIESSHSFKFFQIQFNHENGANIRLLVLADAKNVESQLYNIKERFASFFKSLPKDVKKIPITSIFLPFPSATIEFELYYKRFEIEKIDLYAVEEELAFVLFDIFCGDELSESTVITAAFYLQLCLIKICLQITGSVEYILNLVEVRNKALRQEQISHVLEDNGDVLLEITADIMSQEEFTSDFQWVNKWINLCQRLFEIVKRQTAFPMDTVENIVGAFYKKGLFMISDFLGLNNEMKYLMNHLVADSLNEFYKENSRQNVSDYR